MIPDNVGLPSKVFKDKGIQTERLGENLEGGGFPIIGVNGKQFYLSYKGKQYTLVNPKSSPPHETDGEVSQYFDFIILRKADRKSHTFYQGGYQKGSKEPPTCVSTDGIAPDDSSKQKQAELCDLCPRHEWKKDAKGRNSRECQDSLRLAVLPGSRQMVAIVGEPITDPCLFRLPAASLTAFSQFGDLMVQRFGQDAPYCSYVMRAQLKREVSWPQFEYRMLTFLSDAQTEAILQKREDPQAYRILGLTPEGRSLVRKGTLQQVRAAQPVTEQEVLTHEPADYVAADEFVIEAQPVKPAPPEGETAKRLAAERAARIAQVRAGEQIEKPVEELVRPAPKLPSVSEPTAVDYEVPDSDADMDALVEAMKAQRGS
jgi:hypothetical protein